MISSYKNKYEMENILPHHSTYFQVSHENQLVLLEFSILFKDFLCQHGVGCSKVGWPVGGKYGLNWHSHCSVGFGLNA